MSTLYQLAFFLILAAAMCWQLKLNQQSGNRDNTGHNRDCGESIRGAAGKRAVSAPVD